MANSRRRDYSKTAKPNKNNKLPKAADSSFVSGRLVFLETTSPTREAMLELIGHLEKAVTSGSAQIVADVKKQFIEP
jgi:hypothetical protein